MKVYKGNNSWKHKRSEIKICVLRVTKHQLNSHVLKDRVFGCFIKPHNKIPLRKTELRFRNR